MACPAGGGRAGGSYRATRRLSGVPRARTGSSYRGSPTTRRAQPTWSSSRVQALERDLGRAYPELPGEGRGPTRTGKPGGTSRMAGPAHRGLLLGVAVVLAARPTDGGTPHRRG